MVHKPNVEPWPPRSLPSHCRIDHGTIGYIHTEWPDDERCPVCRLRDEIAALKTRLALAEAVCESCDEDWSDDFGGFDVYDHEALGAWRKYVHNAQD